MSPRHLRFARLVAEGDTTLKAAYGVVYPDASEATCDTSGARLLGKPRIAEYVELLTGEAAETFVVNKHQVMERLWQIGGLNLDSDSRAANAVASALKTLLEHLSPKDTRAKVEITGKDGGPVKSVGVHAGQGGLSDEMTRAIMVQTLGLSEAQADRLLGEREREPDVSET